MHMKLNLLLPVLLAAFTAVAAPITPRDLAGQYLRGIHRA